MTYSIVSDYTAFINTRIDRQEELEVYLNKVEALLFLALREDFLYSPERLIHYYLWTISDLIEQAKEINEEELKISLEKISEIK